MRFETVRPPDAAPGGRTDGGHLRQRARTPVRGMGRRLAGSHRYDLTDLAGRNEAGASAARSVFLNPCDPAIQESPSPESCRLTGDVPSLGDLDVGFAGGGLQDDLGPLDQAGPDRLAGGRKRTRLK